MQVHNNSKSTTIDSVDRTVNDVTASLRRKGGRHSLKRSKSKLEENENSDEDDCSLQAKKAQSEVIKDCHKLPQESSVEDEKKLQRLATRGGMLTLYGSCVLCHYTTYIQITHMIIAVQGYRSILAISSLCSDLCLCTSIYTTKC